MVQAAAALALASLHGCLENHSVMWHWELTIKWTALGANYKMDSAVLWSFEGQTHSPWLATSFSLPLPFFSPLSPLSASSSVSGPLHLNNHAM